VASRVEEGAVEGVDFEVLGAGGESEDKRKSEQRTREAQRNGTGG
jgi:hypothetical protein